MPNSPIVLCGEAWGTHEEKIQQAFVGPSGIELLRMLDEAGALTLTAIDLDYISKFWRQGDPNLVDMIWRLHPEFHRLNVFNLHPPGNNLEALCGPREEGLPGYPALVKGKYVHASHAGHLTALAQSLNDLDPYLVVGLGNSPLWALCGTTGISNLRGTTRLSTHCVGDFKVLSTYHPAAILRQWELRHITVIDFMKITREAASPHLLRPEREIWIEPTIADITRFYDLHIRGCSLLSVDIETSGNQVTCIGFAPSPQLGLVVLFFDDIRNKRHYWEDAGTERLAWEIVQGIMSDPTILKLFQNGVYDIAFLWRSMGIRTYGAVHDTMLLHHALQPESLKGLGFLGSLYTDEGAWKAEHRKGKTIKRDA